MNDPLELLNFPEDLHPNRFIVLHILLMAFDQVLPVDVHPLNDALEFYILFLQRSDMDAVLGPALLVEGERSLEFG